MLSVADRYSGCDAIKPQVGGRRGNMGKNKMSDVISITREEHERLLSAEAQLEDLVDAQAVAAYRANPEPGIPSDLVARIVMGEPPLRVFREWKGLSQSELSRQSGVNRVQIGDIEDRGKTGSVKTLQRLAAALNLTIEDLV